MTPTVDTNESPKTPFASWDDRRRVRQFLAGAAASGTLHATFLAFGALAASGLLDLPWAFEMPEPSVTIVAAAKEDERPIELTVVVDPIDDAEKLLETRIAEGVDWDDRLLEEALTAPHANAPLPTDAIAAKWIAQASEQRIGRSTDENLRTLDELGNQLTGLSSDQAVDEIGGVLGRALGLEDRATAPIANLPEREFDYASAQLHDVEIERDETTGAERYVATLVDRHGTALRQEMDAANGAQAYETMQAIKKFPLLESVYRSVVMKILDRLVEPKEANEAGS